MGIDQMMIKSLVQNGGLTDKDIAAIADAPIAAIASWKSGHAEPLPRHALILADLRHVTERLAAYFAPHGVRRWLHAPHPQLDGARPVDLIRQRRSIAVSAVIDRLDGEVYVRGSGGAMLRRCRITPPPSPAASASVWPGA